MKYTFLFWTLLVPAILWSQNKSDVYEIKYKQTNNGELTGDGFSIYYQNGIVFLSKKDAKIQNFSNLNEEVNISTIKSDGQVYKLLTPFSELPKVNIKEDEKQILGYNCKYAQYSYFSNNIEVWYTEETRAKGSPYSRFLPNSNALALQIIVNGSRVVTADTILIRSNYAPQNNFENGAIEVNDAEFEELKINSRYTKLSVFENEQINFNPDLEVSTEEVLQADSTYHFSKGSVIMKKIKLTKELRESGYVFARLTCKSNGDAYDRTGSVFIVPAKEEGKISILNAYQNGLEVLPVYTDNREQNYQGIKKEGNYMPPIEIMRFFTSFGADHFNEKRAINNYPWANDVVYEQEITSLLPNGEEEIWVGVFIGNYDGGGHIVSLEFDFHPFWGGEIDPRKKYIDPLFSTVNTMEMQGQNYGKLFNNDTLEVEFEVPENIEELQLLFTTTGHGGWGGGDEFNPKLNQIHIDGEEVFKIVPWRTDCATYRFSNPASGNFENGLSSSDLSRSNWCPATLTPPYFIPLEDLKPGKHQIKIIIDQGEDEGSSSSAWSVTGVLCGKVKNN